MSSPYSVLNNRPIDQWKVTELKDELRKRRLKINGLKDELVRRLDEALRTEMEEAAAEEAAVVEEAPAEKEAAAEKEEVGNGLGPDDNSEDKVVEEDSVPPPAVNDAEPVKDKLDTVDEEKPADKNDDSHNDVVMVDNIDTTPVVNQGTEVQDANEMSATGLDAAAVVDDTKCAIPLETSVTDEQNEDANLSAEDGAHSVSEPANQVLEVSPDLGFQVKSDSISTDSVSINEKNELKDNLNANNVNLELEVVKPEMVQPSFGGDLHPLGNDREVVDNQASLEEAGGDATCSKDMELETKIEGVDVGSPEKLNLDRSSGDESMEEDALESKHMESKDSSVSGERSEGIKVENNILETKPTDPALGGFSFEKKDMVLDEEVKPTTIAEKRKAEEQETVNKNEPKRRRWNLDPVKLPETQTSTVATIIPKGSFQPALRGSFTRSDSSVSAEVPKERIVPPSGKPATTSLKIDRFLRPFTLKAVQELLAKTGTVSDFWMDHIKTHCYVTYSSVEEATTTRNALYNLQWPTNGGRQLVAEFVDPQEVKMRVEGPQSPAPITPSPTTSSAPPLFSRQPQPQPQVAPPPPPPRTNSFKQQKLPPPPPLPHLPALSNLPPVRERLPPPPPLPKKPDPPPIMTLDDLFRKTKSNPRIYYLPLSEEQVAAKLADKGKKVRD